MPVGTLLPLAIILLGGSPAAAHRDRLLPLSPDGRLENVPADHGPASIHVRPAGNSGAPPDVTVQLSGREVRLPRCLARLFQVPVGEAMHVHGSWYHDLTTLPPYLVIDLPERTVEPGWFSGYTLMFDMRNGDLLQVHQQILGDDHTVLQSKDALDGLCTPSEVATISRRRAGR
jgi:hypothetical protein